jgi:HK97 gp10 family phage protein
MANDFVFIDNSDLVKKEFEEACIRALARCGNQAEGYAKDLCPVDEGTLRNSISNKVDEAEPAVYVGTNMEYGPYVELGTGIHYPGGRRTPWSYKDEDGHWHRTRGQEAQPFLKPAVADHKQTYRNIIEDELKKS